MQKGLNFTGITIVYFCHDGQGSYLMAKRSIKCRDEHGTWDCGGGGLEFGDNVIKTLKKEIKEEYNCDIIKHEFLGYRDVHRKLNGKQTHWIALDFKVQIDKKLVKNNEPHKFDDLKWFKLNKLPNPLHSQLPKFINLYQNKL